MNTSTPVMPVAGSRASAAPISRSRRQVLQWFAAGCGCAACGSAGARLLDFDLVAVEVASKTWAVLGRTEYFSQDNGGNIVNTSFIEVPDGVVVIDTGPSKRYGDALRELIGRTVPGKPILRVYNTHHHPDHFLGNQSFEASVIAAPQKVIENISLEGDGFTDNMYRLLGDWMRGTYSVAPTVVMNTDNEDVGGRQFSLFYLEGHTNSDFVIRDDETGVVFAGDLAFLYRAPTTPHADIPSWKASLEVLSGMDKSLLVPGHGPSDAKDESLVQTADYIDWLYGSISDSVGKGLTMNEAMVLPIPARFEGLGVIRTEYERSVVHLYPALEDVLYPVVEVTR
ncbi:quinoprotein relay system zinc metallohydrolase 1 [Granulosicoccus antarcticus]|uniref:Hydroxyacylglutathione hydrolase n=1 Tax=Granulosicoccus antarcticus IMCC3135 TaxID=1192854 RepID=A0A2Z2NSE5_9GAMM|nr:quinoprotein relay system zinc metallohydrolase 1 [Granulosicoccus antarcticus]ASJ74243.1 Hydroxyacylglutathione hydrolase [Granulosicoccus antarcticus IMCC3135]